MTATTLVIQCTLLFMVSLIAGGLPMLLSLSHRNMRFVTILGIGILLGTAFAIIIPEGVETIYSMDSRIADRISDIRNNPTAHHREWTVEDWSMSESIAIPNHDHEHEEEHQIPTTESNHSDDHDHTQLKPSTINPKLLSIHDSGDSALSPIPSQASEHFVLHSSQEAEPVDHAGHDEDSHDHEEESGHMHEESESCNSEPEGSSSIGTAMVLGFAIMLIVDRLTLHMLDSSHPNAHPLDDMDLPSARSASPMRDQDDTDIEMDVVHRSNLHHINPVMSPALLSAAPSIGARQLSNPGTNFSQVERERERERVQREKERERLHGYQSYGASHTHSTTTNVSPSALVALIVNSLVDGITLGAIAFTSDWAMTLAVFTSVMIQKAPVAFGFVSYLMYQNTSAAQIKVCLVFFALAAPFSAALTYFILSSNMEQLNTFEQLLEPSVLGLLILFSAGTFLFTVAVHVMPAIHSHSSHGDVTHDKRFEQDADRSAPHEVESLISGNHGHSHGPSHQRTKSQQGSTSSLLEDEEPLEWSYVATLIAGIVTPLLITVMVDRPLVR